MNMYEKRSDEWRFEVNQKTFFPSEVDVKLEKPGKRKILFEVTSSWGYEKPFYEVKPTW